MSGELHIWVPSKFSTFYGLTQMKIIIGYIYAFYATKMGSRDSGETKVDPHWVKDPPWSFNGPCHGPIIHPTWPLYICYILSIRRVTLWVRPPLVCVLSLEDNLRSILAWLNTAYSALRHFSHKNPVYKNG